MDMGYLVEKDGWLSSRHLERFCFQALFFPFFPAVLVFVRAFLHFRFHFLAPVSGPSRVKHFHLSSSHSHL